MTISSETEDALAGTGRELAREVLVHGPISRSELGRRLGLSQASLTRLSKPLLDLGLFIDAPETGDRSIGRPARPLDVRVDAQRFVGVKLTGSRAYGVSTDLRANALDRVEVDFADTEVDQVIGAIRAVVTRLGGAEGLSALGVSVGGKVTRSRIVEQAPFLGWRGVDLGGALSTELGIPVVVENDVVALAAAEHWFGLAKGLADFAIITTGAGVGYGLVIHDRVVVTRETGLGLGGHIPLDPSGPLCFAGHRGCSTAMLSIPSMCATAGVGLGRDVGYDELLALAVAGDRVAASVVDASAVSLGRMIALAANFAMVDTVVLSGEGVGLAGIALDTIRDAVAADRDRDAAPVRILVDDAGFGAWARGAAAVAIQSSFGRLLA